MTQSKDRLLQFFEYKHLPQFLQVVSEPFCKLAYDMVERLPSNPERTVGLRKLLEAKDCAVRAVLYQEPEKEATSAEQKALLVESAGGPVVYKDGKDEGAGVDPTPEFPR